MDEMSWGQGGAVLLSTLVITLVSLSINQARAGEQTRFYGPDGRSTGTATTSGNTTTFYGADGRAPAAPRPAATLKRSTVPMAGGLAPQP
jgi:hypothetical protein